MRTINKRGAMEMSVGTIVTVVLLMAVLVLGIFLVQRIFKSASGAVDSIDNQVQSEISKLFSEEGAALAIYPTSRQIALKKGDDPKGFAFSVKNLNNPYNADFDYIITANDQDSSFTKCGARFTKKQAEDFMLGRIGSFTLGPGNQLKLPRLVKFELPETAPPCTIIYELEIMRDDEPFRTSQIFVTIK
jgi:hypothetical protein